MTTAAQVMEKLQLLNEEQQRQVLSFVEQLEPATNGHKDPYGILAHLRTDLSFEEFQKNRQEMGGYGTDERL